MLFVKWEVIHMKVRSKISIFAVVLAVVPLFTVAVILGWLSYSSAQQAMQQQLENSLISRREAKKSEIEAYFSTVYRQLTSQAASIMMVDAAKEFSAGFHHVAADEFAAAPARSVSTEVDSSLEKYYRQEFGRRYEDKNNGEAADIDAITGRLSDKAKWFQYLYISNNPAKLGAKDSMQGSNLDPAYDAVHHRYHPSIREFLQKFGFYDVFIIDPQSGHVVYSVYKELDFATSLKDGPYSNSGLAKAYQQALALGSQTETAVVDFSAYLPSYNDNAAFLSTPILDNGKTVGVLVFQVALEKINGLMTLNSNWRQAGYGDTGEVYLVGEDGMSRSDSRLFVEDSAQFNKWSSVALGSKESKKIVSQGTTIGSLPIDTLAAKSANNGETGFASYQGYMQKTVMGAYSPVNIPGFNWAIIAEVEHEEAFAAIQNIKTDTISYSAATFIVALVLASAVGLWFARGISRPISRLSEAVMNIEEHNDLTIRLEEIGDDEIVQASQSVNSLVARLRSNFSSIAESSAELAGSASNLSAMMTENVGEIDAQNAECQKVAQSAKEMEVAAAEVARNASETASQTRAANELSTQLSSLVRSSVSSTNKVADEIQSASGALETLAEKSGGVGSVLDVIQAIAEQTNLLALNAAIEAARAGEQGRGFAVVAEEVRNLAQRTQGATGEISTMIQSLQADSNSAVTAMRSGLDQVQVNVEQANSSQQALDATVETISSISDMNDQVATAAEEQSVVVREITQSTNDLKVLSDRSSERTTELNNISSSLRDLSGNLSGMVAEYKV